MIFPRSVTACYLVLAFVACCYIGNGNVGATSKVLGGNQDGDSTTIGC